jgi:hypothetical protein
MTFSCVNLQLLGFLIAGIMLRSDESHSGAFDNVDSDSNAITFCIQVIRCKTYWLIKNSQDFKYHVG